MADSGAPNSVHGLDTVRRIETPEGVELDLHLAGPIVRALAWAIDTFIRFGIYVILGIALSGFGSTGMGILLILLFLVEWFYPVYFEVLQRGMTPGKRAMDIRVVHDDGTPIGWSASMVRNLLRYVDFLPLFYLFGFVSMLMNREFRRLGDIVAGSVVIYPEISGKHQALPEASAIQPAWPLYADEVQTVLGFAERVEQISPERADELASCSGVLIETGIESDQATNATPSKRLLGIAHWLAGR